MRPLRLQVKLEGMDFFANFNFKFIWKGTQAFVFLFLVSCAAAINSPTKNNGGGAGGDDSGETDLGGEDDDPSPNTAPVIFSISDQSTNEDTPITGIVLTLLDAEMASASLSLSVTSSNTTLLANSSITVGGSAGARTLSLAPESNQFGTTTITITVSDGDLQSTEDFLLTVNPVNDAPTIAAIADQNVANSTGTGALVVTIGDPETAAASLTLSGVSSNTALIANGSIVFGGSGTARTVTATPTGNAWGSANITITVNDGTTTTSEVFQVTVAEPNHNAVTFTYPFKDGLRIGESDDQAYTLEGTCEIATLPVRLTVNGTAVGSPANCTSGTWSLTHDFSALADGVVTIATTNSTDAKTLRMFKDTSYCTPARKAAAPFAGGTGTPWYPYSICTVTQFQQISTDNDAHFELRNNIDLSSLTVGEGALSGSLNGNNFQLSGLSLNLPASSSIGLFLLQSGAVVENVHLRDISIIANNGVGGLASELNSGSKIMNASVTGVLECQSNCGLIAGDLDEGSRVSGSFSKGSLTSSSRSVGGLVGLTAGRIFKSSSNSSLLNRGNHSNGGFVGRQDQTGSAVQSWNQGAVESGFPYMGGFAGVSSGEISDSYSMAEVRATNAGQTSSNYTFLGADGGAGLVANTFSAGLMTHASRLDEYGGSDDSGNLTNSYFNSTTTGQGSGPPRNTPLSDSDFTSASNFTGFDFTNVWSMRAERPQLKWEEADIVAPTAPTFIFPNANGYPLGYTDINSIGTYEVEGRCSESQWPVKIDVTTPSGAYTSYESCNVDQFWSHTMDLAALDAVDPFVDGVQITIVASQRDGAGNNSTTATRTLDVTLPTACVDNRASTPFAAGAGTVGDPWIICTETQLDAIQTATTNNETNIHFELGDSIDLNGSFTEVDLFNRTGTFNGKNFRVLNGTVSSASANTHWITFGNAGMSIQNFHLFNFTMSSTADYLSPFDIVSQATNLSFRGSVSGAAYVGGIESYLVGASFSQAYVRANISGTSSSVGGALGFHEINGQTYLSTLVRAGTISGTTQVGGFVGGAGVSFNALNSYSGIQVFASGVSASASGPVGGLMGYANFGGEGALISDCEVRAQKISGLTQVGGLIGGDYNLASGAINFNRNSAEVGLIQATAASGIASGFFALAQVDAHEFADNRVVVGSIQGRSNTSGFVSSMPNSASFVRNFSTAYLTTTLGSVYGMRSGGSGDIANTNNFYDSRTAGTSTSVVGTAKAAYEMYLQSTYTGFDFTSGTGVWKMPKNGGYPLLQWQYE